MEFLNPDHILKGIKHKPNVGGRVCSNCGSEYTSSHWRRTYNEDGSWDGKSYHCSMCRAYFNPNTGKFLKIPKYRKTGGHKNTICSKCGSNYTSSCWYRTKDDNEDWDGKSYICTACYCNPRIRSGELSPESSVAKGEFGVLTIAKVLGGNDCFVMKRGKLYDIQSKKYGRIEVKTATYNPTYMLWHIGGIQSHKFDNLYILCLDEYTKNVQRVYIIPKEDIYGTTATNIVKNLLSDGRYEKFRKINIEREKEEYINVITENKISNNYISDGKKLMSTTEKGCIGEKIIRKLTGAKINYSDEEYDLVHEKYGRIEVKTASYDNILGYWRTVSIKPEKFDILFIVCMCSDFSHVERIYRIPSEYIYIYTM